MFTNPDGTLTLKITPDTGEDFTPFDVYLDIQVEDADMPDLYYASSSHTNEEEEKVLKANMVRYYEEWPMVYHHIPANQTALYIQQFGENEYVISGELQLDNEQQEQVRFAYYGEVVPDVVEVTGIHALSGSGEAVQGEMKIGEEKIPAKYGFCKRVGDHWRYYITDRFLFRDRALEYGLYMDVDSQELPEGKFRSDQQGSLLQVAFFDHDKTVTPESYELTIKYNKKQKLYTIRYKLTLPDGRLVEGNYRGEMPRLH